MLLGLGLIWLALTQRFGALEAIGVAAGAALLCTLAAVRMGGVGRAFAHGPRAAYATLSRTGAVVRGALATIRAAVAADISLKPALVRVRTRGNAQDRAAFADLLSATPGAAVVETDADGLLVHVLDEDAIDADGLGRLERRVGSAP